MKSGFGILNDLTLTQPDGPAKRSTLRNTPLQRTIFACTHYTIMVEYISIQTSLYTKALTLYCLCRTLSDTTRQGASRLP